MSQKQTVKRSWVEGMPRPMPQGMFDPPPSVWVEWEDGTKEKVINQFFPDEYTYQEDCFKGMTREEISGASHRKDVEYLRS